MFNSRKRFNIHDIFEMGIRWKWYALVPVISILLITLAYIALCPRQYMASTLILVSPQKVPEEFVRPTVTASTEDRLQNIAQESLSRTRLEQVISDLNLYEPEKSRMKQEEIIDLMRKNTRVEIKGKEGYFTISYTGQNPVTVTTVTNRLAATFIEKNLKFREQQAQGTTEFLTLELKAKKAFLENLEKDVSLFKRHHMGELPEQREANLRILEQFQLNYQKIGETLRAAEDRKLIIQKQLSDMESAEPQVTDAQGIQLEELKNTLKDMGTRYTDKHPDIISIKRKIEELEKTKAATTGIENNARYKEVSLLLREVDVEIPRLKEEELKSLNQINRYRERIENTPIREQEMASLNREYDNTKNAYEVLMKKSQDAQQAENLEFRQKGEQFKIIDPARVPENPVQPDIPKLLLIGFILALSAGTCAVLIRETLDHSFRDAEDVEITLGFRVLANIPKLSGKAA